MTSTNQDNNSICSQSISPNISPRVTSSTNFLSVDFLCCPLPLACAYLSDVCGFPVSYDTNFASRSVSLHVTNEQALNVLDIISRSLACDLIPVSNGYVFGIANERDNIIISGLVSGYDRDTLYELLSHSLSGCFVSVAPDGYCLISCPCGYRERVERALDGLRKTRPLYSVRVVNLSNWFDFDLLDGGFVVSGSRSMLLSDWFWKNLFVGDFNLSINNNTLFTRVLSIHDYTVLDGDMLHIYTGTKQPVARHTISDSGTNSVSGYDILNIGDSLDLSILGQVDGSVLLKYSHEASNAVGFVGDYPVSNSSELRTSVRCNLDSVLCIGDTVVNDYRVGLFRLFAKKRRSKIVVSVRRLDISSVP